MMRFFSKLTLWHWFWGIAIILVSFSHAFTGLLEIRVLLPKHTIIYGTITPFLLAFFEQRSRNATATQKFFSAIIAFIFSQFVTIEGSFYHVHSWDLCFGSWLSILIWTIQSLVYGYVFYRIALGLLSFIEHYEAPKERHHDFKFHKWFLLIISARLFAILLFYPCVFGFDAAVGLRSFLDLDCATSNHHPFFIQFIHSIFFAIGKRLGHISVGFVLLSLFSVFFSSLILLYGIKLLRYARLSERWLVAITIIYALFPIYPYLSINPTKDGFFAYAFLLYVFTLFDLSLSETDCLQSWRYLLLHNLAILLVCLTRHQGIYIVILECVILLIYYKRLWIKILLISIPALCLFSVYINLLLPYYNVEPSGKQETYGTLFQQTAYCLKQHPDDVSPKELFAINKVLNSDSIVAKYTFDRTDPVKNGYRYNPWYRLYIGAPSIFRHIDHSHETEDLKTYRSAWLSMGLRHPLTYIEATLGVCAGFFYNFNKLILETEPKWAENSAATTPEYRFVHFNAAARIYNTRIYSWFKYPVINWIIAIPYYNWAAIFFIGLLFYRKDFKGLTIFFPVLLSLGILLICPMVYGRYSYPIVMALPLLFAYILSHNSVIKTS